jgi:hypothetical protein
MLHFPMLSGPCIRTSQSVHLRHVKLEQITVVEVGWCIHHVLADRFTLCITRSILAERFARSKGASYLALVCESPRVPKAYCYVIHGCFHSFWLLYTFKNIRGALG